MMIKYIDLVNRQLILKETIPESDKIYSIFETYTELISKNKMCPNLELDKRLNIATNQFHLIVNWKMSNHTADPDMLLQMVERLISKYKIHSLSTHKNQHSILKTFFMKLNLNIYSHKNLERNYFQYLVNF